MPKLLKRLQREYDQALSDRKKRILTAEQYKQAKAAIFKKQDTHDARVAEKREARELIKEGTRLLIQLLKEDKQVAKRTYLVTVTADKKNKVVTRRGKNNKRLKNPKEREFTQAGAFTTSFKIVKEIGETQTQLKKRAKEEMDRRIDRLNSEMFMGDGGAESDTYTMYMNATFSISAFGGGAVGMTRAKPYNYEFKAYASIVDDGNCVPESLNKLYPMYSVERIMEQMGGEGPKTCEQVLEWCKSKDITCIGCDDQYNVIVEYYSRNRNKKPLYFVEKDNHFYLMDKSKGVSIANSRSNSLNKPKDSEEKKIEYEVIVSPNVNFDATNKHYILESAAEMKKTLYQYIEVKHSVPLVQFGAINKNTVYIKSFKFGNNCKVTIDRHYTMTSEINKKLDTKAHGLRGIVDALMTDLPTSFMNKVVLDIFMSWKQRQHYAHLMSPKEWKKVKGVEQTWDANKQYTSALVNMPCGWLVFNMFALPQPYSGGVKDAYYYIETSNTMPCKGNGWYSRIILEWLIKNDEQFKVVYEIIGSTLPADTFKPFVAKAMELTDKFKYITNTLCGSLNTHSVKVVKGHLSANKNEVIGRCMTGDAHMVQLSDEVFACASIENQIKNDNNMPMYSQILDYAAIQLADAIKHLEKKGCVIRGYNTDSITFKSAETLEIDLSKEALGGWKTEEPKPFEYALAPLCNTKTYSFEVPAWESEKTEDDFNGTEEIVDYIINKNESLSLDGQAGFGKSYLLDMLIEKVGPENCLVLGYTNISANNIGGKTFHNTFKIDVSSGLEKFKVNSVLSGKKWIIIDEKSQVPSQLYRICQTANEMSIPIIMAGDFAQILPVGESGGHESFIRLICRNLITLTKYKRGDAELLNDLLEVRGRTGAGEFDRCEKGSLHFCFTKAKRDMINNREMAKVKSGYMTMTKNSNLPKIYVGMPLRSCETKENGDWLNNERWVLTNMYNDYVTVMNERHAINVSIKILTENFVPGYAMTIHSSQGLTIKEPYTVWLETYTAFSEDDKWRLYYTALSRATTKSQIGVMVC